MLIQTYYKNPRFKINILPTPVFASQSVQNVLPFRIPELSTFNLKKDYVVCPSDQNSIMKKTREKYSHLKEKKNLND